MLREGARQAELANMYVEQETYRKQRSEQQKSCDVLQTAYNKTFIKAGCDGTVVLKGRLKIGDTIAEKTIMAEIVPEDTQAHTIVAQVKDDQRGKIAPNMKVKVEVLSYPKADYGLLEGSIVSVSNEAGVAQEATGEHFFAAEIMLDESSYEAWTKQGVTLVEDMSCEISAITGSETVMHYLLKQVHLIG